MQLDRSGGRAVLRSQLRLQLRIPVVVAPMFLVSCPQLVVAACRSGVIGAFPTLNARSTQALSDWLEQIGRYTDGAAPVRGEHAFSTKATSASMPTSSWCASAASRLLSQASENLTG